MVKGWEEKAMSSSFCKWSGRAACLQSHKSVVLVGIESRISVPALMRRITLLERYMMAQNTAVPDVLFPVGLLVNLMSKITGHELHLSWGRNKK